MSAPIVIGHRGVPGVRLEHTRPSYELAIEQGANYIEPDVVCSRDGHLVVRHENEISGTTDIAHRPEFADRKVTKVIDGIPLSGWFTEDLTLDELKSLRTRERLPDLRPQNLALDGEILTFEEVLDIAESATATTGRTIGVCVETKHPTYFAGLDLDLDDRLIETFDRRGINEASGPVVIQSKEVGNLQRLRDRTPLQLLQLIDLRGAAFDLADAGDPRTFADLTTPAGLAEIATYADGIGPHKSQVIARHPGHRLAGETGLVGRAHDHGLLVHVWTMRNENNFLPLDLRLGQDRRAAGDAAAEYRLFLDAGVDGFFSDFTQTAVQAVQDWQAAR
ncbi:glycerophosphodiester phosphodiesterase family protein [Aeromicrobium sp. CF3.5]|uniref:glycerophosphodiester phosphodiesterase family protein n=1 Tax=Aeromicrobium sp. CF3.5 TaxID=3373078 RepID=UPI003EE546AA